jgi:phosphate-selective porin
MGFKVAAAATLLAAVLVLGVGGTALAQGSFYQEVQKDGRIYVFNLMKVYEEWKTSDEMGKSITRPGAGPNGETILFDSEEAIHLYNFKHGLPGEVIVKTEEKKPVMNWSWKDGKTTFEGDRAALIISNRVQVRFTNEQPGDPNAHEAKGSFRIRRAKTKFEGWIYNKSLTYDVQLNWADTASSLEDAAINYDVTKGRKLFQIKGGQFKVPFGRQELTSSGSQQFVDRSMISEQFEKGRDIGLQVWGQTPAGAVEWRTGIFNGAGRNKTANDNNKYQFDARVVWNIMGDVKYSESDFESTDRPLLAVAAQYEGNNMQGATTGDDIDREVFGGDVVFKYKGLSVFSEYYRRGSEPEVAADFDSEGYIAQVGYFVYRRYVEIALRFAALDPSDTTAVAGVTLANDHRFERGVGVNWFMNKHALKLQADYRQIEDEAQDRTDDEARLQMQFIF